MINFFINKSIRYKFAVTFCMKSSNTLTYYCDNFEWKHSGGQITSYTADGADPRFKGIKLEEVESFFIEDWNKPRGKILNK